MERLGCYSRGGEEFSVWTAEGTKVSLLLRVLHPGQRSMLPEESHSKTGCKMPEGSQRTSRMLLLLFLTGSPRLLLFTGALFLVWWN